MRDVYTKNNISVMIRKNIKKYRLAKELTMQELADLTGFTHGYIRDLESLKVDKTPSIDTIAKLCNVLDIEPYMLFES